MSFVRFLGLMLSLLLHARFGFGQAAGCAFSQPAIKDSNTVGITLYAGPGDCCAPFQTTYMGVFNSCHTVNNLSDRFTTISMAVGQNMFGRNIVVEMFTDEHCQFNMEFVHLTNNHLCFVQSGSDILFTSFRISEIS